ncbi:putative lipoprotein [Nitrospira japonica]|uniref:Putative lipoprotein n=1 Tax=Nitrospira japonica TaxID=1325564 RepID=A0A1W1I917_9BACT|nr:BON domain-containing protein [Nitrospira japonica]SLM49490.1 putative lipoprotein [Nitrospira japonica]
MALHDRKPSRTIRLVTVTMAGGILATLAACDPFRPTADRYFDDGEITVAIESRLAYEKVVDPARVEVETKNGIVHLRGTVETLDQRMQAGKVASQVTGVTSVDNELEIYRR